MLPLPRCAMKHSCQPTLMTTAGPNDVIPNTSSAQNPVMAKATVSHGCGTVVKKDTTAMVCLFVSLVAPGADTCQKIDHAHPIKPQTPSLQQYTKRSSCFSSGWFDSCPPPPLAAHAWGSTRCWNQNSILIISITLAYKTETTPRLCGQSSLTSAGPSVLYPPPTHIQT